MTSVILLKQPIKPHCQFLLNQDERILFTMQTIKSKNTKFSTVNFEYGYLGNKKRLTTGIPSHITSAHWRLSVQTPEGHMHHRSLQSSESNEWPLKPSWHQVPVKISTPLVSDYILLDCYICYKPPHIMLMTPRQAFPWVRQYVWQSGEAVLPELCQQRFCHQKCGHW